MDLWIAHNVEQVHFTKTRLTIYHKNNKIIIFTPYSCCCRSDCTFRFATRRFPATAPAGAYGCGCGCGYDRAGCVYLLVVWQVFVVALEL